MPLERFAIKFACIITLTETTRIIAQNQQGVNGLTRCAEYRQPSQGVVSMKPPFSIDAAICPMASTIVTPESSHGSQVGIAA